MILVSVFIWAAAYAADEHFEWDCPDCGRTKNTSNFCGGCGYPAPWMTDEPTAEEPTAEEHVTEEPFTEGSITDLSFGDYLFFGHYEQDNNTDNGQEPIEWLVLQVEQDHRVLIISRYGLDAKPYHSSDADVTWEECSLRSWLNGEFMGTAFNGREKKAILTTSVDNKSSRWGKDGGNTTGDQVYLLSNEEVGYYFNVTDTDNNNQQSRIVPTEFAKARGTYISSANKTKDGTATAIWWLRSPGFIGNSAAVVDANGSLYYRNFTNSFVCVRPALWLDMGSGV